MRGFGGFQAFYYLQTLLTGDNETGRNPARFHTRRPLQVIFFKEPWIQITSATDL